MKTLALAAVLALPVAAYAQAHLFQTAGMSNVQGTCDRDGMTDRLSCRVIVMADQPMNSQSFGSVGVIFDLDPQGQPRGLVVRSDGTTVIGSAMVRVDSYPPATIPGCDQIGCTATPAQARTLWSQMQNARMVMVRVSKGDFEGNLTTFAARWSATAAAGGSLGAATAQPR